MEGFLTRGNNRHQAYPHEPCHAAQCANPRQEADSGANSDKDCRAGTMIRYCVEANRDTEYRRSGNENVVYIAVRMALKMPAHAGK